MEQGLSSHWVRVMMVGVPNIGNARSFLSICVQDGMTIPQIDAWANVSVLYPRFQAYSL